MHPSLRFAPLALWTAACFFGLAQLAPAQSPPKLGGTYEDKNDLGFRISVPKEYDFVPASPKEPDLIGKYSGPSGQGIMVGDNGHWPVEVQLIKFDKQRVEREKAEAKKSPGKIVVIGAKDLAQYIERSFPSNWAFELDGEKPIKSGKLTGTEYQYKGKIEEDNKLTEVRLFAALIHLNAEVDIAVVGNGPSESKKWARFESTYREMVKSLKPLDLPAKAGTPVADANSGSMRDQKRAKLQAEAARTPGWRLMETPNYFVISDSKDDAFLKELTERLEAIRKVYEGVYSVAEAVELRRKSAAIAAAKTGASGAAPEKKDPAGENGSEAEEAEPRPAYDPNVDPMEASRASVVRVCADSSMYSNYGGPPGSAGYWNWFEEELVVFDDKESGGRRNTWATLNHEAFHQYIFYFYGNISPHSWYNEGTGDFYSGFQYGTNKKFTLKPFDWRVPLVQEMMREGTYVHLKKFVRMTQAEYYSEHRSNNYAQGWALIYFLRTAPGKAKCWNPAWNSILPTYLETLIVTGELDQAVDKAYAGIDWDELESCWKAYLEKEI